VQRFARAVELGLDVGEVAEEVFVRVVGLGLEGEGESGVGVIDEGFLGAVALRFEVVDRFLEEEFLEADFDLLGSQDAPGLSGELGDEELLVGGLGGEVVFEALLEGLEVGFVFEGQEGEFRGEAVLDGVETGLDFAGRGAGSGGVLRILLTCGSLGCGWGSEHVARVAWGFRERSHLGGWRLG
jgi:hypothetical protein